MRRSRLLARRSASARPFVGVRNVWRGFIGQELWARHDADAAEVQAVGVPAGLNGDVRAHMVGAVTPNGAAQRIQLRAGEIVKLAVLAGGQLGTAFAMLGVASVMIPATVMQEREELHDKNICAAKLRNL